MTAPLAGTGSGGRLYTLSERSDTHVHALTFRKGPSVATPASHGGWRLAELFVSELFTRQGATGRDSDFFATETPRKRPGPRVVDPDHLLRQPSVVAPERSCTDDFVFMFACLYVNIGVSFEQSLTVDATEFVRRVF